MGTIRNNKMEYLKKQNFAVEVTKSKDVLGNDSIKVKDVLNAKHDKKVDVMSDIFPHNNAGKDDILS